MKYYGWIFIFVLLIPSCKQDLLKTEDIITINFVQKEQDDPFGILETSFIKLETNDTCLIDKTVTQVEAISEKIFILTGGERKLMVFELSGKFIALIGNRGRAPGEYLIPVSFSIDKHEGLISVIDIAQKKLIHYDLKNYQFVSETEIAYDNFSFEYLGRTKMVWNNTDYNSNYANWSFMVTDMDQNHINHYLKRKFLTGYSTGHIKNIYKSNGEVFAYTQYHPIIYRFREDMTSPIYRLKFGKHQLPPIDYLKRISAGYVNFLPELNNSDYVFHYDVFDTGKTFVVFYSVSEIPYIGIYNKINNHIYTYTMEDFQDKLNIGRISTVSGTIDDWIVAVLQPFDLIERKNENYAFSLGLQNIVDISHDDDNPILFLFKVKKS
jgi:hypothetical protein